MITDFNPVECVAFLFVMVVIIIGIRKIDDWFMEGYTKKGFYKYAC